MSKINSTKTVTMLSKLNKAELETRLKKTGLHLECLVEKLI
jgi:hypothetical protein